MFNTSPAEEKDNMANNLDTVMTRDEAIEQFDNYVLPVVIQLHEQDGEFDEPARSEAARHHRRKKG